MRFDRSYETSAIGAGFRFFVGMSGVGSVGVAVFAVLVSVMVMVVPVVVSA